MASNESGEVADAIAEEVGGAGLAEMLIKGLGHASGIIAVEFGIVGAALVIGTLLAHWLWKRIRLRKGFRTTFAHGRVWRP